MSKEFHLTMAVVSHDGHVQLFKNLPYQLQSVDGIDFLCLESEINEVFKEDWFPAKIKLQDFKNRNEISDYKSINQVVFYGLTSEEALNRLIKCRNINLSYISHELKLLQTLKNNTEHTIMNAYGLLGKEKERIKEFSSIENEEILTSSEESSFSLSEIQSISKKNSDYSSVLIQKIKQVIRNAANRGFWKAEACYGRVVYSENDILSALDYFKKLGFYTEHDRVNKSINISWNQETTFYNNVYKELLKD